MAPNSRRPNTHDPKPHDRPQCVGSTSLNTVHLRAAATFPRLNLSRYILHARKFMQRPSVSKHADRHHHREASKYKLRFHRGPTTSHNLQHHVLSLKCHFFMCSTASSYPQPTKADKKTYSQMVAYMFHTWSQKKKLPLRNTEFHLDLLDIHRSRPGAFSIMSPPLRDFHGVCTRKTLQLQPSAQVAS